MNIDYNLLIQAEKIRFQSDFSGAHWLNLVISKYSEDNMRPKIQEAFETVLRIAIKFGIKAAVAKIQEYPPFLGFPTYLQLDNQNWSKTQNLILNNFETHLKNRFGYLRDGD